MAHALIFDSGVGGLSVVREIRARLPGLKLTYIADDAFRPYGDKSPSQLQARLPELLSILVDMVTPDIVVIACNTASTTALAAIRKALDVPVVGVVPAIKPAAQISKTKTLAVLGTPGTVKRRYVDALIRDFAKDCEVRLHGSVNLVQMAEDKLAGKKVSAAQIKTEIAPLFLGNQGGTGERRAEIDTVVLACTHFPLLADELKAAVPASIVWIDSGEAIARRVETVLETRGLCTDLVSKDMAPSEDDIALLIGPDADSDRKKAFTAFGFKRVIGLLA